MRTVLRWLAGLLVAYVVLAALWRLGVAVVEVDWVDIASSILGLMFVLWMFDTFRPSGPTDLRRRRSVEDGPRSS